MVVALHGCIAALTAGRTDAGCACASEERVLSNFFFAYASEGNVAGGGTASEGIERIIKFGRYSPSSQ